MDPDAKLTQLIERTRTVRAVLAGDTSDTLLGEVQDDMLEVLDDVLELHEWLRRGGMPPAEWVQGRIGRHVSTITPPR